MKTIANEILEKLNLKNLINWNSKVNSLSYDDYIHVGWISYYNRSRKFGFLSDLSDNSSIYFHERSLGKEFYTIKKGNASDVINDILRNARYEFIYGKNKNEYNKYREELQEKGVDHIYAIEKTEFGTFKLLVAKEEDRIEVIEYNISRIPYIVWGQLVCFKIKGERVIEIHNPAFYKLQLLQNREKYSNEIWELLFNCIPSLLCSIEYNGIDFLNEEIDKYKKKIAPVIKRINELNLNKYKDLNTYTLDLDNFNGATTRDKDPNLLFLSCVCKDAEDGFISNFFSKRVIIASETSYGSVKISEYSSESVGNDFREEYFEFINEYKSESKYNFDFLVEKHFKKTKEKWVNEWCSNYSRKNHLLYYLNSMKDEFINSSSFIINKRNTVFGTYNSALLFKYNNRAKHHGDKIEFVIDNEMPYDKENNHYNIYYWKEKTTPSFKKKVYKNIFARSFFDPMDKDYENINMLNCTLKKELALNFDKFIEDCVKELNTSE